jgi:hypothetical protein
MYWKHCCIYLPKILNIDLTEHLEKYKIKQLLHLKWVLVVGLDLLKQPLVCLLLIEMCSFHLLVILKPIIKFYFNNPNMRFGK